MSNQSQISNLKLLDKILLSFLKLFLFMLPWQTIWIFREVFVGGIKSEYSTLGFYATEALLWAIILCFVIFFVRRLHVTGYRFQDFKWTKDRTFVLALLSLISYLLLSMFWSREPSLALQQSLRVMEAFLLFFILLLGPLKKEEAIKWLVFGSILPCVLGIWQFLTQSTFASTLLGLASHQAWEAGTSVVASDTVGRWLRAYGPFSHPNVMGGYIVIVLMLTYHITQATKPKLYSVLCCLSFVFLAALFFTFSRSAWLAAVVLLTYHITQTTKLKLYSVLCCLSFVFLAVLFFPLVQTRLAGNSVAESYSISDRVSGYSDAWKLFKQHPVLGVGAGNYTLYEAQPVHNAFVLFAVEGGVVGVSLLFLAVFSFINFQFSIFNFQFRITNVYLLLISFFLLIIFDHYLYSSYIGLMLSAIFFGLILRRNRENTVSPQLVHCSSFDTIDTACHNTITHQEPTVGAGA